MLPALEYRVLCAADAYWVLNDNGNVTYRLTCNDNSCARCSIPESILGDIKPLPREVLAARLACSAATDARRMATSKKDLETINRRIEALEASCQCTSQHMENAWRMEKAKIRASEIRRVMGEKPTVDDYLVEHVRGRRYYRCRATGKRVTGEEVVMLTGKVPQLVSGAPKQWHRLVERKNAIMRRIQRLSKHTPYGSDSNSNGDVGNVHTSEDWKAILDSYDRNIRGPAWERQRTYLGIPTITTTTATTRTRTTVSSIPSFVVSVDSANSDLIVNSQ